MNRWLFLPDSVLADLESLARFTPAQIAKLHQILDTPLSRVSRYAEYVRIGEELRISDQEAARLFSFWEYIQEERKERSKDGTEVVSEFLAFLKTKASTEEPSEKRRLGNIGKMIQERQFPLATLFGDFPKGDHARKTASLEFGPLPHMASFKTFCDLRPVYDATGAEVQDFVPAIILRIRTHSNVDDFKEVFFQLSESQVTTLETEIDRLRKKLSGLRARLPNLLPEQKKSKSKGA